jgi:hypothetical protein
LREEKWKPVSVVGFNGKTGYLFLKGMVTELETFSVINGGFKEVYKRKSPQKLCSVGLLAPAAGLEPATL